MQGCCGCSGVVVEASADGGLLDGEVGDFADTVVASVGDEEVVVGVDGEARRVGKDDSVGHARAGEGNVGRGVASEVADVDGTGAGGVFDDLVDVVGCVLKGDVEVVAGVDCEAVG